jgi:hypothetical protein
MSWHRRIGSLRRLLKARKRIGLSEVIVTLFLIVVVIVSSVMVAGFLFGIMGTYAASPEVAASVTSCSPSVSGEVCTIHLTNIGASNVATTGSCYEGSKQGLVASGGTVPAGGALTVSCSVAGVKVSSGDLVVGSVALGNGAPVYFATRAS